MTFRLIPRILTALIFTALLTAQSLAKSPTEVPDILELDAIDASVDASVNPCDDFYHYACGSWLKNLQLPVD